MSPNLDIRAYLQYRAERDTRESIESQLHMATQRSQRQGDEIDELKRASREMSEGYRACKDEWLASKKKLVGCLGCCNGPS
jgi:hypothetical protein